MNYRNIKQANAARETEDKTTEELPFTNDWIFSMVMRDKDICRELLARILPNEHFGEIHLADPDGNFSDSDAFSETGHHEERTDRQTRDGDLSGSESDLSAQIQAALKFGSESHGVRFANQLKLGQKGRSTQEIIWESVPGITLPTWMWTCSWQGPIAGI